MKLKEKIEKLEFKKILLIGVPIILVLILVVVIVKKKQTNNGLDNKKLEAFIPDSENEEKFDNKIVAYGVEKDEQRKKEREKSESMVKNSDFFKEVTGEKEEQSIKSNESIEDFYERTVIDKVSKGQGQGNHQAYYTETNKKNTSSFYDDDEDHVQANYRKAMNHKTKEVKPISEENQEKKSTIEKKESLQSKLNNHGKSKQTEIDMSAAELDPENYKRKRNRRSNTMSNNENLIRACIHGDQVAVNGASIRMRLLDDTQIDGTSIEKNTLFYGTAHISNERMDIVVTNLKVGNTIINVQFTVYDNDAIKGLNLPQDIKDELAKKTKQAAADQVPINTGGTGLAGSVISSGVRTAKDVFRKDQSQIKVDLKANHQIFIKSN